MRRVTVFRFVPYANNHTSSWFQNSPCFGECLFKVARILERIKPGNDIKTVFCEWKRFEVFFQEISLRIAPSCDFKQPRSCVHSNHFCTRANCHATEQARSTAGIEQ